MGLSVLAFLFLCLSPLASSFSLRDPHTEVEKKEKRPPMYTFFQMKLRRDGKKDMDGKHEEMLTAWQQTWFDKGWEPIILTLDDAREHPDFQHYSSRFEKLAPEDAFIYSGSYNYMCLMRWLAMAAQNVDGFMTDYDTFPLHIRASDGLYLPNEGQFTVYDRFVPSLMSGKASEWDRMAKEVIEQVTVKFEEAGIESIYSDMYALQDVYMKSPGHNRAYIMERKVDSYPYKELRVLDCERTVNVLALHLSHSQTSEARENGLIPENISDRERFRCGRMILDDWKEQCSPNRAANLRA